MRFEKLLKKRKKWNEKELKMENNNSNKINIVSNKVYLFVV